MSYQITYPSWRSYYPLNNYFPGYYANLQTNYTVNNRSNQYLNRYSSYPASIQNVNPVTNGFVWHNKLKSMFHNRKAVIYALHLRTFAAKDYNKNGQIEMENRENGTFLKAISLLPELKKLGVNTIHLLPITPVGKTDRLGSFGSPGSVYSPQALDSLNEEYDEQGNNLSVIQEAKMFVDEAHRLGINIMADIPSCASVDLAKERPDLLARDINGNALTPTNWIDIRMFVKDSPALRDYYQKFFNLMINQLGVDGFRADIARARSLDFWRYFISKYPDKAWLAETYTEEDASPMKNLPRDIPEDLLKIGFDAIYGQFHIFQEMNSDQYICYLQQNKAMFKRTGLEKSSIGSFLTHDDPSSMGHGGALYNKLISGLMATQPDTNPYILDGFTTGYSHNFDIFNWRPRPAGNNPDIGEFLKKMLALRESRVYGPALTVGSFIPLEVKHNEYDNKIIAFMRKHGQRTLLIVANKDVNSFHKGEIKIPGLSVNQRLENLAPNYGEPSDFKVKNEELEVNLGRGRFYMFEVNLQ